MTAITPTSRSATAGEPRPIIPPLAGFYSHARDLSWLVVRLTAGGMLLVHGIMKVMPMAEKGFTATIEAFAAGSMAPARNRAGAGRGLCGVLSRNDRRSNDHAGAVHAVHRGCPGRGVRDHHLRRPLAAGVHLEQRGMGIPVVLGAHHVRDRPARRRPVFARPQARLGVVTPRAPTPQAPVVILPTAGA